MLSLNSVYQSVRQALKNANVKESSVKSKRGVMLVNRTSGFDVAIEKGRIVVKLYGGQDLLTQAQSALDSAGIQYSQERAWLVVSQA